jgi:hypothetical protein
VQDTGGDYGADEDCSFTLETDGATLVRMEWGMEDDSNCAYDYLQLDGGTKYCGTASYARAFPALMAVSRATTFAFHSDDSEFGVGFKICAQPPAGTSGFDPHVGISQVDIPVQTRLQVNSWTEAKTAIENIPKGSSGTVTLATGFNCSYSSQITVAGNVTVHGYGAVCDAAQGGMFFHVNPGAKFALDAMTLKNGKGDSVSQSSSHTDHHPLITREWSLSLLYLPAQTPRRIEH